MPRLILTRHAEAVPHHPSGDFHRPLTEFGVATAQRLGAHLDKIGGVPDEIIASAATRTMQTANAMGFLDPDAQRSLHNAPSETLLDSLRGAHGSCVLLVAHNPGIANAALRFWGAAQLPPHLLYFQPATTVVFDLSGPWHDLNWTKATPVMAIDPSEL